MNEPTVNTSAPNTDTPATISPEPETAPHTALGRGHRVKFPNSRLRDYDLGTTNSPSSPDSPDSSSSAALTAGVEPPSFSVAIRDDGWCRTMQQEIVALESNGTWELTDLPPNKKALGCRWVYKIKHQSDGFVERLKARLVVFGNHQVESLDYGETFAPVVKMVTIRTFLAVTAVKNWELHQMDVHNAFLHGDLNEEVYMKLPSGFGHGRAGKVRLHVLIYVDDLVIEGNDSSAISTFKAYLNRCLKMKDLGPLKYFLGIDVARSKDEIFLSQNKKFETEDIVRKILRSHTKKWLQKVTAIEECKDLTTLTYEALMGSLMAREINLDNDAEEKPKAKGLALNALLSDNESDLEEEVPLLSKRIAKIIRKQNQGKFESYKPKKSVSSSSSSRSLSRMGCFKCSERDHQIRNCPKWEEEKTKDKREKSNQEYKRAMIAAVWGESDSEDEEPSENEKDEKFCLRIAEENIELRRNLKNIQKQTADQTVQSELTAENESLVNEIHALTNELDEIKRMHVTSSASYSEIFSKFDRLNNDYNSLFAKNKKLLVVVKNLEIDLSNARNVVAKWEGSTTVLDFLVNQSKNNNKLGLGYDSRSDFRQSDSQYRTVWIPERKVNTPPDCSIQTDASNVEIKRPKPIERDFRKHKYVGLPEYTLCKFCGHTGHGYMRGGSRWYLDSGCSRHMTGNRNQFLSLSAYDGGNVTFGDNKKGEVIGIGKVGKSFSHSIDDVLLGTCELPRNFWAEAVNTACYIRNRVATRSIHKKMPYELLYGRKPNISHFRCFGSKCYVHNNGKNNLGKFDPRSDEAVFIEYSNESKAYKFYNKRTVCFEESVHVIFDETNVINVELQDDDDFQIGFVRDDPPELEVKPSSLEGTGAEHSTNSWEMNRTQTCLVVKNHQVQATLNRQLHRLMRQFRLPNRTESRTVQSTPELETFVPRRWKHQSSHPMDNILTVIHEGVKTRSLLKKICAHYSFLSELEPSNINDALTDPDWVIAMQKEINQFERSKVWHLEPRPRDRSVIGTKWVFRNKLDDAGVIVRNKARLVVQGYNKQEGIDYDETFAPVVKLEAIHLLIAFAAHMGIKLFQMDVKTAFLNGYLQEEVYVEQPPSFLDSNFPNHVYKLDKALYGLKQAPRSWYDRLSKFLIENGFQRGSVDKTLFLKPVKEDLLVVQIYVDDIIFGATNDVLCAYFSNLMQ
ncbi:uncharacterized protein LOC141628816 [Silene latifolia]|uniref:uncharacterized protein LOC141628816 n=1 Tax=Silene latifolia TaxID=37657 RepID=UPI003D77CD03